MTHKETDKNMDNAENGANRKWKNAAKEVAIVVVILCGLGWVLSRFLHLGNVEYTDNAQVRQNIVPVVARVTGFVKRVPVEEYQTVRKGDTLLAIEDAELRLRLAQAEADLRTASLGKTAMGTSVSATRNNLSVSDAGIEEARALLDNAKVEADRTRKLLAKGAATQQQFDAASSVYDARKARYDMLVKQKTSTSLAKDEQGMRLDQQTAGVAVAKAAVELARLNLSYAVVTAPCNGVVGRKNLQEGQLVQAGQSLFSIVDGDGRWVVANYKETQMSNIAKGKSVAIKADALPGKTLKGEVCGISDATGSQYSLVPQDNAAGNFIKVEQLVPVKICFTGADVGVAKALRTGMNVESEVKR